MMATSGDLIQTLASVSGIPQATILTYYRSLREAGLVTKGGRGPSAARMKSRDAALLLIAAGGARSEKEPAKKIVQDFMDVFVAHTAQNTPIPIEGRPGVFESNWVEDDCGIWKFPNLAIPSLQGLGAQHSIIDALTALLDDAMAGAFDVAPHFMELTFYGPEPRAALEVSFVGGYTEQGVYLLTTRIENATTDSQTVESDLLFRYGGGDCEMSRRFTHRTIHKIAKLLASNDDRFRGAMSAAERSFERSPTSALDAAYLNALRGEGNQ